MYRIEKRLIVLLAAVSFALTGCSEKKEEVIKIDYEHIVLEEKPTFTPEPTIQAEDKEEDAENNDNLGNQNENEDITPGVIEIDGMKFTSVNDTVKVIAGSARLRTGPSTDYPQVIIAKAGDRFTRTAIGDGKWDQLQYQGETVYIWNEYIQKIESINKAEINNMMLKTKVMNLGMRR